ncbi:beta-defensin 130B isoform X1 [Dipodomys merriami]|uniref:beta-defensin 130B isoform X1 n=1 Tax=Dipodomys merriami TaxID=94247 RepID=UPI00384E9AE3
MPLRIPFRPKDAKSKKQGEESCQHRMGCKSSTGNTGLVPGTKRCTMLKGKCHEKGCTTTEHKMGECSRRKVCCRKWWIYGPYPTPVPKAKPS